jgi:hypothetical protein
MSEAFRSGQTKNYSFESSLEGEIHEKALKGQSKSHGTSSVQITPSIAPRVTNTFFSLGTAQPAPPSNYWTTEFLDGENYPVGIFRFKYRSRGQSIRACIVASR